MTFTLIACVVDVHRSAAPERDLLAFAVFTTFFRERLLAGLDRASAVRPQR